MKKELKTTRFLSFPLNKGAAGTKINMVEPKFSLAGVGTQSMLIPHLVEAY
jgi:hypothetical protein